MRAYAYTPDDIDRVLAELAEMMRDRLPPSGLSQEELLTRSAWSGPHHFVLIDDEQELRTTGAVAKPAATAPLWPLIERSREIGLHVIATRLPGNWAGVSAMSPFLQKLTGSRAPTLVHGQRPADREGVRPHQCSATAAGPRSAGHHRWCDGRSARRNTGLSDDLVVC